MRHFSFKERMGTIKWSSIEGPIAAKGEIDVPLSKTLSTNAAARYTSYNTSGNYTTWKVGMDWAVLDTLRFRATRSRDIRAPTLYDLFAPVSQVQVRPTDLLTGASPTVPQIDESNPNLTAEIGNTMTLGVVWKPLPKLSFAVDAYRIKISDAITTVSGSTAAFQTEGSQDVDGRGPSVWDLFEKVPGHVKDKSDATVATLRMQLDRDVGTIDWVRVSCQTIALCTGSPVFRSHSRVVSR